MASAEKNAILAISSLDRYISNLIITETNLEATWTLANPFNLTIVSGQAFLGAQLDSRGSPGWPPGVVTILAVNNNIVTIDIQVTANSNGIQLVFETYEITRANAPVQNALIASYENQEPYSNSFTIQSPGALIYGYISKIIISQIQIQYNIPTVNRGRNDILAIAVANGDVYEITIPDGFYWPDELAAALTTLLRNGPAAVAATNILVTYSSRHGFTFESEAAPPRDFFFPSVGYLVSVGYNNPQIQIILKVYKLIGITNSLSETFSDTTLTCYATPNFLYTPYIDFFSDVLTGYQNIKDTNTSVTKPKGLIARVYLSGNGNLQATTPLEALGSRPFVMVADLNSPKVLTWSPVQAVPSIDFQLLDQYGDLIPIGNTDAPGFDQLYPTEFQMTLLCIEGRE